MTGLSDELYIPQLKNLNTDCRVCLGHELRFSIYGTLQNKVSKVVSYFYGHPQASHAFLRDCTFYEE